jgi:hypothetical protein
MSTPKSYITNTFLSLIDDRDLCVDLTDEEMTEILDYYLKDSTYLRFKNCSKDLTDHEEYDFHTDTFTADGINKVYTLTDYPSTPNSEAITYVCTVNGTSVDYTFDSDALTFTLDELPDADDTVICGYEFVGVFGEDLTNQEIYILAYGMLVSWFSKFIYNHQNLKNKISTKDYTIFSPANLLDKLLQVKKDAEKTLRNLVISYSFDGFEGFDSTRDT